MKSLRVREVVGDILEECVDAVSSQKVRKYKAPQSMSVEVKEEIKTEVVSKKRKHN